MLLRRWEALPRVAAAWSGPVLELWYWPTPQVWEELTLLIAAERAASRVLVWSLHHAYDCPLVRIESATGRSEDLEAIAILTGTHRATLSGTVTGIACGPPPSCNLWRAEPDRRFHHKIHPAWPNLYRGPGPPCARGCHDCGRTQVYGPRVLSHRRSISCCPGRPPTPRTLGTRR